MGPVDAVAAEDLDAVRFTPRAAGILPAILLVRFSKHTGARQTLRDRLLRTDDVFTDFIITLRYDYRKAGFCIINNAIKS